MSVETRHIAIEFEPKVLFQGSEEREDEDDDRHDQLQHRLGDVDLGVKLGRERD